MPDFGEQLCRSMEIIVAKRLEGLRYDRTILGTIIDDSLSKQGKYTVCYADTNKFIAYSNLTNLHNNDMVYVSIPEGDWNEQKTIISKKSRDDTESFVYLRPFSRLVDITNNINENSNTIGLIANEAQIVMDNGEEVVDAEGNYVCVSKNETYQTIYTWEYNSANNTPPLVGYTRLGIRGEFQSWLKEEGLINGEYGLRLILYAESKNTIDAKNIDDTTSNHYVIYLNQNDMNGDPYNFQTFYSQEKIVDISAIEQINKIEIEFYQKGNFQDEQNNTPLAVESFDNRPRIMPNLFVKDVYISFGYGIEEFEDEKVLIYTLDKETYGAEWVNDGIKNHKHIFLRWIHKDENGNFSVVTEDSDLKYEIRWYKYELGHASADEYSGVYWKQLSRQYWDANDNAWQYEIQDQDWIDYNLTKNKPDLLDQVHVPGFQSTWCIPVITLQDESIKAIIVYDTKIIRSNIIEFKNQRDVVSQPTVEAMSALQIYCDDSTPLNNICTDPEDLDGNYLIYDLGGNLVDQADRDKVRQFVPYFNNAELTEAEWIEWIVPEESRSMIRLTDPPAGVSGIDGKYHVKFVGDLTEQLNQKNLTYTINNYYSQWNNDNTIQCRIRKKGLEYSTVKELTFGHAGNNGTNWTFVLDFKTSVNAITINSTDPVIVTAHLYDYSNKEMEITDAIKWTWKNGEGGLELNSVGLPNTEVEVKKKSGLTSVPQNNYNILQAEINYNSSFKLKAFLPIPIRQSFNQAYITGPVQITYDTAGHIMHYRKLPYTLYDDRGVKQVVTWSLQNGESDAEDFAPKLEAKKGEYYLAPLSVYVDNTNSKLCICAKNPDGVAIWAQPLLILQNRYPTSMINEWDGSLKLDTDNNAVLAAQVVAGIKDENNRFSGVVLGNVGQGGAEQQFSGTTGLYGFQSGVQSYAFKENGTAFIGLPNTGRIYFDGSSGEVYSSNWSQNLGMHIDIKNGVLKMNGASTVTGNSYTPVTLNYTTYKANSYYQWQPYVLATGSYNASTQYYKPITFQAAGNLNGGTYYIPNVYYTHEEKSSTDKTKEYKLSTSTAADSSKTYYYPSVYEKVTVNASNYTTYTYYILTSEIWTQATSDKYNPTCKYAIATDAAERYISLDATQPVSDYGYPLSIGISSNPGSRNFRVRWDGTVFIQNGEFEGEIHASSGTIDGFLDVSNGTIWGGTIDGARIYSQYLQADNGIVGGWLLTQSGLISSNAKTILGADGTIRADKIITDSGEIGGWYISENGLTNQPPTGTTGITPTNIVSLKSNTGTITGAIIEAGTLKGFNSSQTDIGIDILGFLRIYEKQTDLTNGSPFGYFGAMYSNYPGITSDVAGLGMGYYTNARTCVSQFKTTAYNVGFKYLIDGVQESGFMTIDKDGVSIAASSSRPVSIARQEGYNTTTKILQRILLDNINGLYLQGNQDNSITLHQDANKITLTANEINIGGNGKFIVTSTSGTEKITITCPVGITSDKFKLAVDTGNVEIGGTLKVTGDTTLNTTTIGKDTDPKALTVTGASTFKNSVTLTGTATNLTVGGTTTSTGKITASGGITIATSLNYTGTKENCTGIYATLA